MNLRRFYNGTSLDIGCCHSLIHLNGGNISCSLINNDLILESVQERIDRSRVIVFLDHHWHNFNLAIFLSVLLLFFLDIIFSHIIRQHRGRVYHATHISLKSSVLLIVIQDSGTIAFFNDKLFFKFING